MSFLTDLFNWGTERAKEDEWSLGRFSDAYKPLSSFKKWESSIIAFENEDYFESTSLFLEFLKDPYRKNIHIVKKEEEINFEFYQGSKLIQGKQDKYKFRALAKIAQTEHPNIGLLRRLLDKNYLLKYSRFAIDEDHNIIILFDSFTPDANPNKLYHALKEIAIQADKLDDIILDEFEDLKAINNKHIIDRSKKTKDHQYDYLIHELKKCFHEIDYGKLNTDQFPGAISYLLLALNYKIDYLLKPEGFLMDLIEKNHRIYFSNNGQEVAQKNNFFIKNFRKIQKRKAEEIKAEFYDVISTFGVTSLSSHESLVNFINSELPNMKWYLHNNHRAIASAIPSYIVGYCLFNYALPIPDMQLLKLFYKVTEPDFFYDGKKFSPFFTGELLNVKQIKKEIENIIKTNLSNYPYLKTDYKNFDTSGIPEFSQSFLNMICKLDMTRA